MAYDIETARVRIGLESTDTSKDAELTAAMDASLNFAEKYCDRFFMLKDEIAEEIHFTDKDVQLHRFPLVSITSINADNKPVVSNYHMEKTTGRVVFDSSICAHTLLVSYSGGYAKLPGDLELAIWKLFDVAWGSISATATGAAGGGAIKAISSSGARVEFDTSRGGANLGGGGLSDPFAITILDLYALKSC
jgi:hypothetical protein